MSTATTGKSTPRRTNSCQRCQQYLRLREALAPVLPPGLLDTPLAKRPYDLRATAVSTWLSSGVDPQTVAKRAGHSVEVLYRIYTRFIHGSDDEANARISARLRQRG
jgi:hypothetical protein